MESETSRNYQNKSPEGNLDDFGNILDNKSKDLSETAREEVYSVREVGKILRRAADIQVREMRDLREDAEKRGKERVKQEGLGEIAKSDYDKISYSAIVRQAEEIGLKREYIDKSLEQIAGSESVSNWDVIKTTGKNMGRGVYWTLGSLVSAFAIPTLLKKLDEDKSEKYYNRVTVGIATDLIVGIASVFCSMVYFAEPSEHPGTVYFPIALGSLIAGNAISGVYEYCKDVKKKMVEEKKNNKSGKI